MPAVPKQFWLVGGEPRALAVTSVTPSRIYLRLGDEGLELDRAAFVEDGEIRVAGDTAVHPGLAVTREEALRRAGAQAEQDLGAVEARIEDLKNQLAAAKATRKRLRRTLDRD
jgi:hypothetical protein